MKRIIIACDGTWNRLDAEHPTNVAKLARAVLPVAPDGAAQVTCHLDGVGSGRGTGWLARATDRALGGLLGLGLLANIADAYRFLVFAYAPGDEIYLFGFSRGAFTARSLAGLIRNCGILERAHAGAIPEALALYRARSAETGPDSDAACAFRARHAAHVTTGGAEIGWRAARGLPAGTPLGLAYLGVWDTVGALGVPGHLRLAALANRGLAFHDTALSRGVRAARHAVAIDERRRTFPPTLWDNLAVLNAGTGRRPTSSAGSPATMARSAAAGRSPRFPTMRCSGWRRVRRRRGWRSTRRRWRPGATAATGAGRWRRAGRRRRSAGCLRSTAATAAAPPGSRSWRTRRCGVGAAIPAIGRGRCGGSRRRFSRRRSRRGRSRRSGRCGSGRGRRGG